MKPFDKYSAYATAVQSPYYDVRFLRRVYRELSNKEPELMREDFCGTFSLCCEWAKLGSDKNALGLDIDPEPIAYGQKNYLPKLSEEARTRISIKKQNVLQPPPTKADVICALNFSYFAFHDRSTLLRYFTNVRKSLRKRGVFIVDIFGGPDYGLEYIDTKRFADFTYTFAQESFDPISNHTLFKIHFTPKHGRPIKNAFVYDWRMWSIPEIKDLMSEAGFRNSVVYWEGTARNGRGSGEFHKRAKGEACQIWVAYIAGQL